MTCNLDCALFCLILINLHLQLDGLVMAWDRGQLISNISFINYPDPNSQAMRAVEIVGRCL
jgi:hypothetical protein